ncbi:MAG: S41 family peptidase, partial [Lysobacteraceae bacterium]
DDVVWAPDSRHLAFVRASGVAGRSRIGLYSLDRKAMAWLTGVHYESGSPAFSPDGQWLWFLSEREFKLVNGSPWGDRNTGPYFDRRTRIYALALQPGNRFPFQARDELQVEKTPDSDAGAGKGKGDAPDAVKALVWNGLAERLFEVPVAAGNYASLAADAKRLYFLEREGDKQHLRSLAFDADKAKLETFASDVKGYALSGNGKVLAVQKDEDSAYLLPAAAKAPDDLSAHKVRLDDWRLRVDPVAEWRQMFDDAWRMHRDHFYDARLRGVDWQAVRARYAVLLPRVTDRLELDDLFGQMIGELNALHSQVRGGEYRKVSEVPNFAGLGARFAKTDGGWRIEQIYRTDPELPSRRGPLQKPGSDIRAGDVVAAVNGRAAAAVAHISELVRDNAGQQVLLTLSRGEKTWQEVVVPADAMGEDALRYSDWLISRREAVDAASGGRIGYLHLRAMGPNDIAGFVRDFYAQVERDGLIVDVRRNRGGNIDSWVFEKLLRRVWAFWQRPGGLPYGNMQQSFRGHIAVLADAMTYSDGETFAAGTRALGIGPLIGTRTAGAGVWLTDSNALVDKGRARVAEIPQYDLDGQWIVEGTGVAPDIEVDNLPHESFNGSDRQLDAAIQWLTRKLEADPVKPLRRGAIAPLAVR